MGQNAKCRIEERKILLYKTVFFIFTVTSSPTWSQKQFQKGEQMIRYQCGACHVQSLPTAKDEALEVFNLENSLWARNLTDALREKIIFTVKARISLSDHELSYLMPKGYKPLPKRPTQDDVDAVTRFLNGEKNKTGSISDFLSL